MTTFYYFLLLIFQKPVPEIDAQQKTWVKKVAVVTPERRTIRQSSSKTSLQHHTTQQQSSSEKGALSCLMDTLLRQMGHHDMSAGAGVKDLWTFSSLEALSDAAIFDKVTPFDRKNANSFNYKCLECHSFLHHHHKSSHAKSQIISHFSPPIRKNNAKTTKEEDATLDQYFQQIRVIFQRDESGSTEEPPTRFLATLLKCKKCTVHFATRESSEGSLIGHIATSKCWNRSAEDAEATSHLTTR